MFNILIPLTSLFLSVHADQTSLQGRQKLYSSHQIEFAELRATSLTAMRSDFKTLGLGARFIADTGHAREFGKACLQTIWQIDSEIKSFFPRVTKVSDRKINVVLIGGQLVNLWFMWNQAAPDEIIQNYNVHWLRISRKLIQDNPQQFESYFTQFLLQLYQENPAPVFLVDSSVYGFSIGLTRRLGAHLIGQENIYALDFIEGVGNRERRQLSEEDYANAFKYFRDSLSPNLNLNESHYRRVKPHNLDAFLTINRFDPGKYSKLGHAGEPEGDFPLAGSDLQRDLRSGESLELIAKKYHTSNPFSPEGFFLRTRLNSLIFLKSMKSRFSCPKTFRSSR